MGAVVNGMAVNGGVIPYGGTFLDILRLYAPGAASYRHYPVMAVSGFSRMTASGSVKMDQHTSRSSTWLPYGAIPGMVVIRPGDANETSRSLESSD